MSNDDITKSLFEGISDNDIWKLIESFFTEKGAVSNQTESYNDLVINQIPSYVNITPEIPLENKTIKFRNIAFEHPVSPSDIEGSKPIYPLECIHRSITYASNMYVDIHETTAQGENIRKKVFFGSIPVMIKSALCNVSKLSEKDKFDKHECPFDEGGYFIINGQKKMLISQERVVYNKIQTHTKKRTGTKYDCYSETRSTVPNGIQSTFQVGFSENTKLVTCFIPYSNNPQLIHLNVVFFALGVKNVKDIFTMICGENPSHDEVEFIIPSLEKITFMDQETSIMNIGRCGDGKKDEKKPNGKKSGDEKKPKPIIDRKSILLKQGKYIIENEILPHLGKDNTGIKLDYIVFMIKKMIRVSIGKAEPEDRDDYDNKRIETTGSMMFSQYCSSFKKFRKDIITTCEKNDSGNVDICTIMKVSTITTAITTCILDRNWSNKNRKGVAQTFEQLNFTSNLSSLRRLAVPIGEGGTVIAPRNLHGSHWFVVCPSETPEGKKCGVIKNLSVTATISLATNSYVGELFSDEISITKEDDKTVMVMENGRLLGYTNSAGGFITDFVGYRRSGDIPSSVSISFVSEENVVYIWSDAGRLMRPVFVVENGKHLFTKDHISKIKSGKLQWSELISCGVIELLDKSEDKNAYIACSIDEINDEHTHSEIDPALMFGIAGSLIPFPDHNQSPRNCYQCAMSKQAIGIHALNYDSLMSGTFNVLDSPQKPICNTRSSGITKFDEIPSGQNAMTAIVPILGYSQEDSLNFNQAAIERGLFRIMRYYHYFAVVKSHAKESFDIPTKDKCGRVMGDTRHITEDDFCVSPGQKLKKGDVIICKISQGKDGKYFDHSIIYEHELPGIVRKVQVGTDGENYPFVRVSVVQTRTPALGDKFASRSAQKGTMGMMFKQEDLPFTCDGTVPDILLNPLALPSRMTLGQMIECLSGKAIVAGKISPGKDDSILRRSVHEIFSDCSPFRKDFSLSAINSELKRLGYNMFGDEMMINGVTGEPLKCLVFFGPVFYQRLKHMAIDKIHARARGGKTMLTRQPKEGRAVGGGLRIGVMEVDTFKAQGASNFLVDRMMEQSDEFKMWVCNICGLQATFYDGKGECKVCNTEDVKQIRIPYGTKLLIQELMGMGISTRMIIK